MRRAGCLVAAADDRLEILEQDAGVVVPAAVFVAAECSVNHVDADHALQHTELAFERTRAIENCVCQLTARVSRGFAPLVSQVDHPIHGIAVSGSLLACSFLRFDFRIQFASPVPPGRRVRCTGPGRPDYLLRTMPTACSWLTEYVQ